MTKWSEQHKIVLKLIIYVPVNIYIHFIITYIQDA